MMNRSEKKFFASYTERIGILIPYPLPIPAPTPDTQLCCAAGRAWREDRELLDGEMWQKQSLRFCCPILKQRWLWVGLG